MTTRTCVVALGQTAAGDDGVGFAVLEALRDGGVPPDVELIAAREASALVPLLRGRDLVVVIDGMIGTAVGQVTELAPGELDTQALLPVSTHGIGVAQALGLARVLGGEMPPIRIVAVTIARPTGYADALTPAVEAAVPRAAAAVRALIGA